MRTLSRERKHLSYIYHSVSNFFWNVTNRRVTVCHTRFIRLSGLTAHIQQEK